MDKLPENEQAVNRFAGLDYLSAWVFGYVKDGSLMQTLTQVQEIAQEAGEAQAIVINDLRCMVKAYGSGPPGVHRRLIQIDVAGLYIGFCDVEQANANRPLLKMELKGELFLRLGDREAWEHALHVLKTLGISYGTSKISRADFRSDHLDFSPENVFDLISDGHAVTHARQFQTFRDSNFDVKTLYIGAVSGDVCCRVYDKLAQIGGDEERQNLYSKIVLDGREVERVTRVEFQVRRKALVKRFRCCAVEGFFARFAVGFDNLTRAFLRLHADPVDRTNTSKALRIAPLWAAVQDQLQAFAENFQHAVVRVHVESVECVGRKRKMVVGYLAKIAAALSVREDSQFGLEAFINEQCSEIFKAPAEFADRVTKLILQDQKRYDLLAMESLYNSRLDDVPGLDYESNINRLQRLELESFQDLMARQQSNFETSGVYDKHDYF